MMEDETENNSQRVMIDVRIVMRNSTAMEATVSLMIALMIHGVCLKKNLFLLLSTPETSPASPLLPRRFGIEENERVF
jgi:hypothetical protein